MKYIFLAFLFFLNSCAILDSQDSSFPSWNNSFCPVTKVETGFNVPVKKEIFTVYQNKRLYFCSPECREKFWKNPEKYRRVLKKKG